MATPNNHVRQVTKAYHAEHADRLNLPGWTDAPAAITADADRGRVAGLAYDLLPHDPTHPDTKAAYDALKAETRAQYEHAVKHGLKPEAWYDGGPGGVYDFNKIFDDVRHNNHMWYEPTDRSFGPGDPRSDHPLFEDVPGMPGMKYNDLFRVIHDYYGHIKNGHDFSPTGELRAWLEHARMFSPLARKALTTETHGQNSWVHYGPHLKGHETSAEKPYADQKAGLLPPEAHPKVKLARDEPELTRHERAVIVNPTEKTGWLSLADHHEENGNNDLAEHIRTFVSQMEQHKFLMNKNLPVFLRGAYTTKHSALDRAEHTLDPAAAVQFTLGRFIAGNQYAPGVYQPSPYNLAFFPKRVRTMYLTTGHPVHTVVEDEKPTKLNRVLGFPRIAEDMRLYRQMERPKMITQRAIPLGSDAEHERMHDFFTNRGLKVKQSPYTYYDEDSHTFHHPEPENKAAVARSYMSFHPGFKLARKKPNPEEAAFTNPIWAQWQAWKSHLADNARRGKPNVYEDAPPIMDDTSRLVFADWLAERGDPREAIVRGHVERERRSDDYGGGFYPHRAAKHPETVHTDKLFGYNTVWHDAHPVPFINQPEGENYDFTKDLIHPVAAHEWAGKEPRDHHTYQNHPVVTWRHAGTTTTRRSWGTGRDREHPVMFSAPVTREQYYAIADILGPKKAAEWHAFAKRQGFARPDHPTQLARAPEKVVPIASILPDKENLEIAVDSIKKGRRSEDTRPLEVYAAGGKYILADGHHRLVQAIVEGKDHVAVTCREAKKPPSTEGTVVLDPNHEDGKYGLTESLKRNGWVVKKLARERIPGLGASTRASQTDTHATRIAVVRHVLTEAGLTPSTARAVLTHTDKRGIRPGVSAMIANSVNPVLARYAAAWMGLLTGERKMTIFHPGEGEDTMHVIDSPHPVEHVGEYMRRSGVPAFTLEKRGAGTRAYVVAPMNLLDVQTAARGLHAKHAAVRGTAVRLGDADGSSDAEARSAFRTVIDDAEKEAGNASSA